MTVAVFQYANDHEIRLQADGSLDVYRGGALCDEESAELSERFLDAIEVREAVLPGDVTRLALELLTPRNTTKEVR